MRHLLSVIAELGGVGGVDPSGLGLVLQSRCRHSRPRARRMRTGACSSMPWGSWGARRAGNLVLLEPLNRYEDHMVNRLDRGGRALRAVGMPPCG